MKQIPIPDHHLMLTPDKHTDSKVVKELIQEHIPALPDQFGTVVTIILGSGQPDIHAGKEVEVLDNFSIWLPSLFMQEFQGVLNLSIILWYMPEQNVIRVVIGCFSQIIKTPDAGISWTDPNLKGPVEV